MNFLPKFLHLSSDLAKFETRDIRSLSFADYYFRENRPSRSNNLHIKVNVLQLFMSAFLLNRGYNSILKNFTVIHLHSTSTVKFCHVEVRQSVLLREY
jgi:hypothetical protein